MSCIQYCIEEVGQGGRYWEKRVGGGGGRGSKGRGVGGGGGGGIVGGGGGVQSDTSDDTESTNPNIPNTLDRKPLNSKLP